MMKNVCFLSPDLSGNHTFEKTMKIYCKVKNKVENEVTQNINSKLYYCVNQHESVLAYCLGHVPMQPFNVTSSSGVGQQARTGTGLQITV